VLRGKEVCRGCFTGRAGFAIEFRMAPPLMLWLMGTEPHGELTDHRLGLDARYNRTARAFSSSGYFGAATSDPFGLSAWCLPCKSSLSGSCGPADPDAGVRAWLRSYAMKYPGHGFRRAWASLRFDEGSPVNKKRVHRLWREEGLQVRAHHPCKRAGCSSMPSIDADAPKVVWALDF
jgi:hypothetical protein